MSPPEHAPDLDDDALESVEPPRIRCRACTLEIADECAVFSVSAGGAVQVFPNPGGWLRSIVTVRHAENLRPVSAPTTELTWFAGCAWTIVVCDGGEAHLGWRYDTTTSKVLWPAGGRDRARL